MLLSNVIKTEIFNGKYLPLIYNETILCMHILSKNVEMVCAWCSMTDSNLSRGDIGS